MEEMENKFCKYSFRITHQLGHREADWAHEEVDPAWIQIPIH